MSNLTHRLAALFAFAAVVFTGVSAMALPEGYREVEYLDFSGGARIDTGVHIEETMEIGFKLSMHWSGNWSGALMDYNAEHIQTTRVIFYEGSKTDYLVHFMSKAGGGGTRMNGLVTEEGAILEGTLKKGTATINGKTADLGFVSGGESNPNTFYFTDSGAGSRLYYLTITNSNDGAYYDFIPCVEAETGKAGLWDGSQLLVNTTGTVTPGPFLFDRTVTFVVTASPQEYNTDPATIQYGATNVVAGDVLSATDVSLKGGVVACLGYKLYNYTDGEYVFAEESTAKSYTVKADDINAGRKLEWQWDSWQMPIHRRTLPSGYQQVTYIESTGSQYINTKFVPDATTTLEMDFNTGTFTGSSALFGQVWGGDAFLFNEQGNNFLFHGSGNTICPFVANAEAHLSITSDNKIILTIAGEEKSPVGISRSAGTGVLGIFAIGGGGYKSKFRLYAMQIYQGGVLVRDYVPCRQLSDGAVGLYDLADHSGDAAYTPFYANVGSGVFVSGEDIIDPTAFYVDSIPSCNAAENPIYYGATNVEAGTVLTAPTQIVATDGRSYNCLGWRLFAYAQENNEWVQIEGADGEGAENSYTVKAGDVGTGRKLCWIWEDAIGGRVRGVLVKGGNWESFGSGKWYYDMSGTAIFDIGMPHVVAYGFLATTDTGRSRYNEIWGSNSLDNYETYNTEGSGWTKLYVASTVTYTDMKTLNWPPRIAGTENQAYRYYLLKCPSSWTDMHIEFYSKELLVSQEPVEFWAHPATETFNQADPAKGAKFTGHVDFVPGAGEATVTLYVANTDHGDDLAAWQADSSLHTFAADGTYATGASFTIYAANLPSGVWFGRVFATAGGVTKPSQKSGEFAVGTSPYYPPAYMKATSYSKHYDGNLNNGSDSTAVGMDFLVDDDVDVEIVAVRVFHFNSGRVAGVKFTEDAGATFDFGVLTPHPTVTTRQLYTVENWPTDGWTDLCSLSSKIDCFNGYPTASPIDLPLHPSRWAKFVRIYGVDLEDWDEVEFRTLPRPPEPIVHDFAMGEPKGTSIGLTGYLAYRGNANKSPCSVYVSCVPPGNEKNYQLLATGWENATEWAGAVTGLSGETTYELNVIVSNELAGVQVITNACFTTPQFVPMPPSITFTGVTPDSEGNVTFSWNLTDTGTAGGDVDVYAKWGPDVGNLCEGVKIAEGVAIGLGSAKCEQVEAGADLVFVLYAVNNGGTDTDGTKTSALTDSKEATTFGPSSFASGTITREANTGVIRANGSIDVFGLGQSRVEIAYANVGSSETNTILVRICQEGDTKGFNLTTNLNALAEGSVYCELRLTNSGRGKTWVSATDSKTLICGPTLPSHFNNTYQAGANANCFGFKVLSDGGFGTYLDNLGGPFTIDLGNKRTVHGAWLGFKNANGRTTTLYTSENGVDYTPVMAYPLATAVTDKYVDFVFPSPVANVRYLKIQGNGQRLDLAEFYAIGASSDLIVSADHVMAWGNKVGTSVPVNAPDDPNGVYFSGTLISGGPAHVYACLSRKDLGADAEAWLKSTHKDLGEFASGAKVEGYLPGATPGVYYGKLVAVRASDDAKVVSPQVLRTVVGSKTFPNEILMNSSAMVNAERIYDGVNNNFKADCGGQFIFPLKDLNGRNPVAIRLWPNSGSYRLKRARIYISSNAVDFATTDYRTEPKPIKTYASEPSGIVWTEIANFGKNDDFVEADMFWEIPLLMPTSKAAADVFKNATYIKVANIEYNNCSEMELRLLRPAGMTVRVR